MKNRIGFFGGSFNPVTKAHIELIKNTIEKNNLSKVYFVPMGNLYNKKDLLPLEQRIEMLKIAFENDEKFDILEISNIDKKTTASDTFQKIDELFKDDDRFFIMGSDNYNNIKNWKNSENLIKNYNYIILDRDLDNAKNISSTIARQKIKQKEDTSEVISASVFKYIKQKNLYV